MNKKIETECYECSSNNTVQRDGYLKCLDCLAKFTDNPGIRK